MPGTSEAPPIKSFAVPGHAVWRPACHRLLLTQGSQFAQIPLAGMCQTDGMNNEPNRPTPENATASSGVVPSPDVENPVQAYFRRSVRIVGFARPAWQWMIGSFGMTAALAALAFAFLTTAHRFFFVPPVMGWALAALLACAFVALFLVLLRSLFTSRYQFTIFTLALSGIAFFANSEVLDHGVFPPFTLRTTISLWVSFAALALSILDRRLPVLIRHALLPVLVFGAMLCVAFVVVLSPFMAFSWAFVWAGGLGFLPYSPLFALIGFALAARGIFMTLPGTSPHRTIGRISTATVIVIAAVYGAYYKVQWDRAEALLQRPITVDGHNRIDGDLPEWLQRASHLPVNHVTEMLLQPDRGSGMALFGEQSLFDPLAFLASVHLSSSRSHDVALSSPDAGRMLHLLFGHSFAHLDRLWRGDSLITTDMNSHVQLHPELRVAYTETTLSIRNEHSPSRGGSWFQVRSPGLARPEEAIYTIHVPEGSICTKLSLWIDGEERPARLTFPSKARQAYRQIVGHERRDPAYVEWLDGNRLRLRVFPVPEQRYRTVRIGIISPLREEGQRLHYERITLEGPDDVASQDVRVDLFGTLPGLEMDTKGIWLTEKVVSDGQVRQFTGRLARSRWSLSMPAPEVAGTITAGGHSYQIRPLELQKKDFVPSAILVPLNGALSREQWKDLVSRLYDFHIPVYLLTAEWFSTGDRSRAMAYIDTCEIPSFNLPPLDFPLQRKLGRVLWAVAGEDQSIPLGELRGSERFDHTRKATTREPDPVVLVNGRPSTYVESLIDLHRLLPVATSEEGLFHILRDGAIEIPVETPTSTPLPQAGIQLQQIERAPGKAGSDLVVRLLLHRRLMHSLGQRFFDRDVENKDLVQLARDGMMVSPVSSLIVLESEKDYERFGIQKDTSLLGQSQLEAPGGVPEPHEVALMLCLLAGTALYLRARRKASHAG